MFEKIRSRSLSDLYIGIVANVSVAYIQSRNYLTSAKESDYRLILKLDDDPKSANKLYEEVFSGTFYETYDAEYSVNGDLVVWQVEPILPYCTDEELIKNKISIARLVEIYNMVNHREKDVALKLIPKIEKYHEK